MRLKKCTRGISSSNTGEMVNDVNLPPEIVIDILTRLPAKVVGQCKCICKHWRALIEDPTFAELHHNRAKCRPDGCYLVISLSPAITFDKIDFFSVGYEGGSAQHLFTFPTQEKGWYHIKQSVNGLICGYLMKPRTIFIVNPTTKEVFTLPQSSMPRGDSLFFTHPRFSFGFDPSTKQYKVFNVSPNLHPSANTEFAEYSYYQYEIFTLGTHSWRKIDVVPPSPHFPFGFGGICVNGVIYWRSTSTKPSSTIDKEVIVAFDLKEERFRVIPLPDGPSAKPCLRELGGHLAACEDFPEDVPEELWILEDYENWVWVKVIITPPCNFVFADYFHTNGAIQTGEILLHSPTTALCSSPSLFDICYYDRKNSSMRRIDVTGLPLSEVMGPPRNGLLGKIRVSDCVENLLSLRGI
ncbi:putative F-box protein At1g32420 [Rhododendron vialii]|uniref:putative F-box protein At1g32420 n=1 Tax=Rhododendron vialii TaxID=182163 RepID=UPI00265E379D|nr:putative F-box protein At1g32420 [Rhododendron vialii]